MRYSLNGGIALRCQSGRALGSLSNRLTTAQWLQGTVSRRTLRVEADLTHGKDSLKKDVRNTFHKKALILD